MTAEPTRSALVAAGVELLEETGGDDIGLRAIARRAGVSHGAPRRWFPTHRALLAEIAGVGLGDLARALAAVDDGGHDALTRVATAYVDFASRRPAMFTLMFRHDLLEGAGADLRSVSGSLFARLAELVEQSRPGRDPGVAAAALWTSVHGIAVLATTGALGLAAPGVPVSALIERAVTSARVSA